MHNTNSSFFLILQEQYLSLFKEEILCVCAAGMVPVNSRGEKQRVHLRDSFLGDQIDPIYVAYNL